MVACLAMGLIAVGCRETGSEGEFFRVSGKLFIFNYRVATATYLVTLAPLQPMKEGRIAVASFEDPAGGPPIEVRQPIWPKLGKVTLESPPLRCVAKDKPYAIRIRIEDPAGKELQLLATTLTSSEAQDLLPDAPLVVGPLYTPNPELSGRPDGKLPERPRAPCPAKT